MLIFVLKVISKDPKELMLYLDVTISGWFPAGIQQLEFVRGSVNFSPGNKV